MSSDNTTFAELEAHKCNCEDDESVVSPSAYLADLLDYITNDGSGSGHVKDVDGALSIDALENMFYQPFGELTATTETSQETVRHVRLCVEILLRYLEADGADESDSVLDLSDGSETESGTGVPDQSTTEEYRTTAYEALLDQWGVSRDDLRAAAYNNDERGWIADAIGVPEWTVPDLWLDPDAELTRQYEDFPRQNHESLFESTDKTFPVSEANLEDIFGLPALTKSTDNGRTPTDPLRTIEEPYIRMWRIQYLRNTWMEEDHPSDAYPAHLHKNTPYANAQVDSESTRPIIDPDLIGPDDFRVIPDSMSFSRQSAFPSTDEAFSLWETRRKWVDSELESIWKQLPVKPDPNDDFRDVLNTNLTPISYANQTGERVWYPSHQNRPSEIPTTRSSGSQSDGPFAGLGFLEDFGRLYRQLTGDTETAKTARNNRTQSQYPTGNTDESPAEAARSVIRDELHLTEQAFVRLVDLLRKYYADDKLVDEAEWWEVNSIIVAARKRSLFDVWIKEETSSTKDIHLDRKAFWQPQREPQQGEWSFRLDRHDPVDPDSDPEPYIDPERLSRSDLPEQPRGQTAHELYENRQQELRDKRDSFIERFETHRQTLQSEFETLRQTHDTQHQNLTSGGSVPEDKSTIDGILDAEYNSVSWPSDPESDWESRVSWIHEGLQLAKKQSQSGSSLSNDQQQQVTNVQQQLDDLRLSNEEFRELHRLRERAKLSGPEDDGLSPERLTDLFAVLPKGNPLDPILTTVYESKQSESDLQPIYADPETPPRWEPLFDDITRKLEDDSGSTGQQSSVPSELNTLGLSTEEFESILSLRRRALPGPDDETPPEALVSKAIGILTSRWKRNKHFTTQTSSGQSTWLTREQNHSDFDHYWEARKARLPKWRATREDRTEWQQTLYQRSSAPLVDPDLIEGVDDFEVPAWEKDAFDLWKDRKNFLFGSQGTALVSEIEQLRADAEQGNHKLTQSEASNARTDIDTALKRTIGVELSDLREIYESMARGDDAGIRLTRLDLTPSALSYVLEIDDHLGTQPIRVEEWESLKNILLRAWKQRQHGRWGREERALGLVLEPQQFDLPDPEDEREAPDDENPLRWRVEWSIRKEWEDILETRIDQLNEVDEEIEQAVAAAEKEALPVFREMLIERINILNASRAEKVEWLSERLLIDTEMYGGRETTRTGQAITSLQDLLQSLNLHLDKQGGLRDTLLTLDDNKFTQRWQWLGTYETWKAAMGVYLYPENVLLPTLRRRTTEKFDRITQRLSRDRDLTASRIYEAAEEYRNYLKDVMSLVPVAGCMAPRVDSNKPLAYVVSKSKKSDTYYFKAFDPTWTEHRHENSTWTAIPVEEMDAVSDVVGAAAYQESIYLFITSPKSSGSSSNNGDGEESSSREQEIKYVRYDTREQHWDGSKTIEIPDEGLNQIKDIDVVITEGWDQPPELDIIFQTDDYTLNHIFVQFEKDGTSPDTEKMVILDSPGDYWPKLNPIATFALDDVRRVSINAAGYYVYELDKEMQIHSSSFEFTGGWGDISNAIYRPHDGEVLLIDEESTRFYMEVESDGSLDRVFEDNSSTQGADLLKKVFQCNNITEPSKDEIQSSGGPRQRDVQENVLIGVWRPDWSNWTAANRFTQVPVTMIVRKPESSDFISKIDRALVPAIGEYQSRSSWLYGPELDDIRLPARPLSLFIYQNTMEQAYENTKAPNHVYIGEAYYYLPLFFARQLTQAGEYEEALQWFRTVYNYAARKGSRSLWPGLNSNDPSNWTSDPDTSWLLDPIDPHAIAETRPNAYTKFTLFSIIRCFSEYADDEFAQDTPKSIANATDLYEQALDLLETDILHRDEDPCRSLIDDLEGDITLHIYVSEPPLWEQRSGLSKEEVEAKTDELVEVVEGIDDYTDRKEAVAEIRTHVVSGDLQKALDVANKYEESEQEESAFKERIVTVMSHLTGNASENQRSERALTRVAKIIGNSTGGNADSRDVVNPESSTGDFARGDLLDATTGQALSGNNIDAAGLLEGQSSLSTTDPVNEDTTFVATEPEYEVMSTPSDSTSEGDSDDDIELVEAETDVELAEPPTLAPDISEAESAVVDSATMDIIEATRHQFCIPRNPLLTSLRRHAEVNLEKIRSGRNIAGMKRELDPYASSTSIESATPTPAGGGSIGATQDGVQPTNYRYETLVERAKELAEQARQFEAELLTAVEKAEREEYKLKKARQQVELAQERVSLQETRMERAQAKVELAQLKREKARIRRDAYEDWSDSPLVEAEEQAMNTLQSAVMLQQIASGLHAVSGSLQIVAAGGHLAAASIYGGQGKAGAATSQAAAFYSSTAAAISSFAASLSTQAGALSTRAQVEQIRARKQRRQRRYELKEDIAEQNYEIGTQRIEIAEDTVDIVRQEREIAQLRTDHAEDIVNFHENKFTNEELYQWIADVLQGIYRYFLQQSASVAKMAQRQLAFERQGLPRKFIKSDYWEAPTQGQTAVPAAADDQQGAADRRGMTGSARLLQDIYELDQHEFWTDQRRLQVEKTVSVAELDPMALQQFRETGVLSFATTLEDFDVDHPGHYHRMIEDVDVTIVALTPPTEGINATLRNSGTSRIVVGDTLYKERTIDRDPESIVLNRARSEEAENELRLRPQQREKLRPFEHSGVATDWELEMPRPANDMDYSTIVDVQLTIQYSALESYDYRQQVISELDPERTAERSYSFHDDFGDAWYELVNAPADGDSTTVTFDTERDDFPSNLLDLSIESAQLYFVVPGPNRAGKREDLKDLEVEFGPADGSGTTSEANGTVDIGSLDTDDLDQDWELTVTPTNTTTETPTNMANPFADGTIEDVLLIVTAAGESPNWPP